MAKLKVYFETFGCTSNRADTDIMAGFVQDTHEIVEDSAECDVAVINSCGVIEHTQRKVLRRVAKVKGEGKKVVLAGCLPRIDIDSSINCGADAVINPEEIHLINEVVDAHGGTSCFSSSSDKASMKRRKRRGEAIAAVPIAEGCLGSCSYCATRFSRGRLKSFPIDSIVKAVEDSVYSGCREIHLTAQDTGQYGLDTGCTLSKLINEVVSIDGDFRLRIGMMNPFYAGENLHEIINSFKNKKVFKFLHLPLQSGDNNVLDHMCRRYTLEDFKRIVTEFRKRLGGITLSTDIIVGYPIEDEESFSKTYGAIEKIRPDILNITRFSPRPNTKASKLKDIPDRIKKERSRKISMLAKKISMEINREHVGSVKEVLISEMGKNNTLLARSDNYKQVIVKDGAIGEFKKVGIEKATPNYLVAG